jgi:hypothetical protein
MRIPWPVGPWSPVWVVLLLTLGPAAPGAAGPPENTLSFLREQLEFRLDLADADSLAWSGSLDVAAFYAFGNPGAQAHSQRIRYPWPRTGEMGPLDWIELRWLPAGNEPVVLGRDSAFVDFQLELAAGEERTLSVRYRQRIRGGRFTYLLTTARSWERPIQEADFLLRMPATLVADSCSLKADACWSRDSENLCSWQRREFHPEQDFVLWYHRAKP